MALGSGAQLSTTDHDWGLGRGPMSLFTETVNWAVSQFPLEVVNNLVSLRLYSKAERISTYPSTPTPDTIYCVHNPWDPACCPEAGKLLLCHHYVNTKVNSISFPFLHAPSANTSGGYSGRTVGRKNEDMGKNSTESFGPTVWGHGYRK